MHLPTMRHSLFFLVFGFTISSESSFLSCLIVFRTVLLLLLCFCHFSVCAQSCYTVPMRARHTQAYTLAHTPRAYAFVPGHSTAIQANNPQGSIRTMPTASVPTECGLPAGHQVPTSCCQAAALHMPFGERCSVPFSVLQDRHFKLTCAKTWGSEVCLLPPGPFAQGRRRGMEPPPPTHGATVPHQHVCRRVPVKQTPPCVPKITP